MINSERLCSIASTEKFFESSCSKEVSNEIVKDCSSSKSTNDDIPREMNKSLFDLYCPESMAAFWDDCDEYDGNKKQDPNYYKVSHIKQDINISTQLSSSQLYPLAL